MEMSNWYRSVAFDRLIQVFIEVCMHQQLSSLRVVESPCCADYFFSLEVVAENLSDGGRVL